MQDINHFYIINLEKTCKRKESMGPLRFELRTSAMSRRRHNQLDHEPAIV